MSYGLLQNDHIRVLMEIVDSQIPLSRLEILSKAGLPGRSRLNAILRDLFKYGFVLDREDVLFYATKAGSMAVGKEPASDALKARLERLGLTIPLKLVEPIEHQGKASEVPASIPVKTTPSGLSKSPQKQSERAKAKSETQQILPPGKQHEAGEGPSLKKPKSKAQISENKGGKVMSGSLCKKGVIPGSRKHYWAKDPMSVSQNLESKLKALGLRNLDDVCFDFDEMKAALWVTKGCVDTMPVKGIGYLVARGYCENASKEAPGSWFKWTDMGAVEVGLREGDPRLPNTSAFGVVRTQRILLEKAYELRSRAAVLREVGERLKKCGVDLPRAFVKEEVLALAKVGLLTYTPGNRMHSIKTENMLRMQEKDTSFIKEESSQCPDPISIPKEGVKTMSKATKVNNSGENKLTGVMDELGSMKLKLKAASSITSVGEKLQFLDALMDAHGEGSEVSDFLKRIKEDYVLLKDTGI